MAKISHTSSSWSTASAWTDSVKETPPTPAPPACKEYDIPQRDYDLPIPYQKETPDDYERDNYDNVKVGKVTPRTLHTHPLLLPAMHMIVPRSIKNYPPLPQRLLPTTMTAKTMMTKKTKIRAKDTPHTPTTPSSEVDDSAHRDYNTPIPS